MDKALISIFIVIMIVIIIGIIEHFVHTKALFTPAFQNVWTKDEEKLAIDLLDKVNSIMNKLNIVMIPVYGTLLGFVRHKGLIPWDDDMDVIISHKDFSKIWENEKLFNENGLMLGELTFPSKVKIIKISYSSRPKIDGYEWSWPFIDVFGYNEVDNDVLIDEFKVEKVKKSDIFPLISNTFGKLVLNMPNNPDSLLELQYGKNWETECIASSYNHKYEKPILQIPETRPCKDVVT